MAPLESLITPLGWQMLGELPPVIAEDPDVRAVIHCYAMEVERTEDAVEQVRLEANPLTCSSFGMDLWERLLHLPLGVGADLMVRRARAVARFRALQVADPAGTAWWTVVTSRIGTSAWSYEENTPVAQTIRVHLPYAPTDAAFVEAERVLREETPSEQALVFVSASGFILDVSQMDVQGLGI